MAFGPTGLPIAGFDVLDWQDRWALAFKGFEHRGDELLATMNAFVLVFVWVLAPFLMADCLSSERRQGTLGILLLTPMRAVDVVAAKWVVHGWQAAWIYLAMLPILVLPVLAGGVSWVDGVHTALVDTSAIVLALSAGLVASSLWDGQRAVLIGAACVALAFAVVLAGAWALAFGGSKWAAAGTAGSLPMFLPAAWSDFESTWISTIVAVRDPRRAVSLIGRTPVTGLGRLIQPTVGLGVALGVAATALGFVARRVRASVRENRALPGSGMVGWDGTRRGLMPRLRRWVLGVLRTRKPFLWVELRTWRGHVVPGLCVGIVFPLEAWRTTMPGEWGVGTILGGPVWVLAGIVAFAAASCLYDERASGSLELLLTVPKGARRLLMGKFGGLALQALPAVILVLGIETAMLQGLWDEERTWAVAVGSPVTLAMALGGRLAFAATAGALFGLKLRGLVPACIATILAMAITAWFEGAVSAWVTGARGYPMGIGTLALAGSVDAVAAVGFGLGTYRMLRRREPIGS